MQRDMDLVRRILMEVEGAPHGSWIELNIEGYSADEVSYHVMLLAQAGLITAIDDNGLDENISKGWVATGLTWSGHEFLRAARDDSRWQRAKRMMAQSGKTLSFEAIKAILQNLVDQQFKPH